MARIAIPAAILVVSLTLFALFDTLLTPASRMRSLPKAGWVAVVLLLPVLGPLLWLFRGRKAPLFGRSAAPAPRPASPDDDEAFLRSLRVQRRQAEREKDLDARERELRAREEELRRRREGEDPDPQPE